jgi:hypothetical protein
VAARGYARAVGDEEQLRAAGGYDSPARGAVGRGHEHVLVCVVVKLDELVVIFGQRRDDGRLDAHDADAAGRRVVARVAVDFEARERGGERL